MCYGDRCLVLKALNGADPGKGTKAIEVTHRKEERNHLKNLKLSKRETLQRRKNMEGG